MWGGRVREGRGSYRSLPLTAVAESVVEAAPRLQGLAGPDPEASGDAHDHGHQVLDHEDGEVGTHGREVAGRAGYRVALASL